MANDLYRYISDRLLFIIQNKSGPKKQSRKQMMQFENGLWISHTKKRIFQLGRIQVYKICPYYSLGFLGAYYYVPNFVSDFINLDIL